MFRDLSTLQEAHFYEARSRLQCRFKTTPTTAADKQSIRKQVMSSTNGVESLYFCVQALKIKTWKASCVCVCVYRERERDAFAEKLAFEKDTAAAEVNHYVVNVCFSWESY